MNNYINLEKKEIKQKYFDVEKLQETTFTEYICHGFGWRETTSLPKHFEKVIYLGNCKEYGDTFAAYKENVIYIFRGIKGNEF